VSAQLQLVGATGLHEMYPRGLGEALAEAAGALAGALRREPVVHVHVGDAAVPAKQKHKVLRRHINSI
jgi:hypothetical protein